MTSLVSTDEVRALVDTGLTDEELQAVIDRVEDEITEEIGEPYGEGVTITETLEGGGRNLYLKRPVSSVSSVTEYASLSDTTGNALTENEQFYVWGKQGRLERISAVYGDILWGRVVQVVYVPVDQRKKRKDVVIDLVRIVVSRSAYMQESVGGEYSYMAPSNWWESEKRRVMKRIRFTNV